MHYDVGQQLSPHFDFIDANAPDYEQQIREQGQRMITFLLYLNDDYAGGESTFSKLGIVNRGVLGDGLYFINAHDDRSPDRTMLHIGSPPSERLDPAKLPLWTVPDSVAIVVPEVVPGV